MYIYLHILVHLVEESAVVQSFRWQYGVCVDIRHVLCVSICICMFVITWLNSLLSYKASPVAAPAPLPFSIPSAMRSDTSRPSSRSTYCIYGEIISCCGRIYMVYILYMEWKVEVGRFTFCLRMFPFMFSKRNSRSRSCSSSKVTRERVRRGLGLVRRG